MQPSIVRADFENPKHVAELRRLLGAYAESPEGSGTPLTSTLLDAVYPAMARFPGALSLLAYQDGEAIGFLNAFTGFSTFAARPLLNIHDIYVAPTTRGRGIGRALLLELETIARERGCCKLTLEVLEHNARAMRAYRAVGFEHYELNPELGHAVVMAKSLS